MDPKCKYTSYSCSCRPCSPTMMSYLITEKLLEKYHTSQIITGPNSDNYPIGSVAPFKRINDNFFIPQQPKNKQ